MGNTFYEHFDITGGHMVVAVRSGGGSNYTWYRGVVTKKYDGQGMVEIFLVDTGKFITVSYTNIKKLAERFRNLECQAIVVKMAHIEPANNEKAWNDTAIKFLNKYVLEKQKLRMLVYDPFTTPEVLLFEHYATVDVCINAVMVKENLALAIPGTSLQVEWIQEGEHTSKKEVPYVFDLLDTIQSKKNINSEHNDSDEDGMDNPNIIRKPVNVLVTHSPDFMYISLNDEESKRVLYSLQLDIQNYYSRHHSGTQLWKKNDLCVVFNEQNNVYYRAKILKEIDKNEYLVLLRDTAEEIAVDKKNICILENQFTEVYEGAIRCHMGGICPAGDTNNWSLLAIEFLQNVINKQTNIFMSKNGPVDRDRKSLSVEMWYSEFKPGAALEPSKTVFYSINKLLIKNGLALKNRVSLHSEPNIQKPVISTKQPGKTNTFEKRITIYKRKDKSNTKKEPNSNSVTTTRGRNNSSKIKDDSAFKQINPLPFKIENEKYYATDEAFLHRDIKNIRSEPVEKRSKSVENNEFANAIDKTIAASVSAENILVENSSYLSDTPFVEQTPSISDWNELIEIHEAKEAETNSNLESVTDWLPPIPFSEVNFYACATFVDDHAHIYLHDIKYERSLQEMEEKMRHIFDSLPAEPKGTIWVPGQICTVKYFVTSSWYRGKIIDITDEHIKVFMVDYGNIEECKHDDLRFKVMYTNVPAFANKIQLYKIFPKINEKWLTSDLDELHKMVVEKKLFVMLKGKIKPNFVIPAIVKVDNTTVNEWMLQKSTNLAPLRVKQPVIPDTEDVVVEEEQSDDQIEQTSEITAPQSISSTFLPPNTAYTWKLLSKTLESQKVPVGVVNILNFDKFIIEFVDDANVEAKKLFENISDDIKCRGDQQPVLLDLQVGQACITQFSEDGEWYRGQVYSLENINYGAVDIWFVDFGNFESVQRNTVRAIHSDWLQLPVQQYVTKIHAIELRDESQLEDVLNQMSVYCNTVKTAEIICIEPLLVQLYNNDELCYKDLIEKNLLKYNQ